MHFFYSLLGVNGKFRFVRLNNSRACQVPLFVKNRALHDVSSCQMRDKEEHQVHNDLQGTFLEIIIRNGGHFKVAAVGIIKL